MKGDSGGNETVDSLRDEISGLQKDIADWEEIASELETSNSEAAAKIDMLTRDAMRLENEKRAVERKRIACRRIHLVPGNHDKDWTQPAVAGAFTVEPPICVLKIDGQKIVLSHYPMADWQGMGHGSWHLHGHIHSGGGAYNEFNRKQGLLRYDVGCDANGHSPVSLDELREWFAGVDEPCDRVKWPWWVNETGDRQVERELAAYKRKEQS